MRRIIIAFLFTAVLASCKSGERSGVEDKKQQLTEYKDLISEYKQKVEMLEKEIDTELDSEGATASVTPVKTKYMAPEEFSSYFTATGTLEAKLDAMISPEINGQISDVIVDKGDRVKKGDLLLKLSTDVTQNSIREVKTNLELAKELYKKQKQLWEKEIGSEVQYLETKNRMESLEARLNTLESQLAMSFIRAPFAGIIDNIMVKKGELATPGMPLARLVNLADMKITTTVSESFISSVNLGDTVELSFSSYPELNIKKPISRIGTVIDPDTRTFEIEVIVENKEELLRPNMLSVVKIQDYYVKNALLVPSIVLKEDFNGTFLYIVSEKNDIKYAEKVYVNPGMTVQDVTKINSGINEGDEVITVGYNLISDEEEVTIKN